MLPPPELGTAHDPSEAGNLERTRDKAGHIIGWKGPWPRCRRSKMPQSLSRKRQVSGGFSPLFLRRRAFGFLRKTAPQEGEDGGFFRFKVFHLAAQFALAFDLSSSTRLPSI
jgi:hypothetical protein